MLHTITNLFSHWKHEVQIFAKINLNLVYFDNSILQHWNFNVANTLFWICKWIKLCAFKQ